MSQEDPVFPLALRSPLALYVHLPFCARRCPYCDFATSPLDRAAEAAYLEALGRELTDRLPPRWRPRTVYLGGGTPAELTTAGVERLIELLGPLTAEAQEVTLEANPRTLLRRKLSALQAGLRVDRLSLGVQSFTPRLLRRLGRFHRPRDVEVAVAVARDLGVPSIGLDLIFAIPGQRERELEHDLEALLRLAPDHVSTYGLTIEHDTAYGARAAAGRLLPMGDDRQARYYRRVRARLRAAGYEHYEVSNFARPGHRSLHNRVYWRNAPFHAVGLGAASHVRGTRETNHRVLGDYLAAIQQGGGQAAVAERERLPHARKVRETAYLALRTSEGIVPARFRRDTGVDPLALFAPELERLFTLGLLTRTGERVHLSGRAVALADAVARELL